MDTTSPLLEAHMVASSDLDISAFVAKHAHSKGISYGMFIPISCVAWDYILTLDREIRLFWLGPRTKTSILFFVNRYSVLMFNFVLFSGFFLFPGKDTAEGYIPNCKFVRTIAGLSYLPFVPWAVFSGIRAYALSRRLFLSVLIFLLALVPSAVHFGLYLRGNAGAFIPVHGCSDSMSTAIALVLTASRATSVLADFLLILVTVCSLGRYSVQEQLASVKQLTFSGIILWNGTIYFVILLIVHAIDLSLSLTTVFSKHDPDNTSLTVFAAPITALLTSHFLLDLKEANQGDIKLVPPEDSMESSLDVDRPLSFAEEVASFGSVIFAYEDGTEEFSSVEERFEDTGRSKGVCNMSPVGHGNLAADIPDLDGTQPNQANTKESDRERSISGD